MPAGGIRSAHVVKGLGFPLIPKAVFIQMEKNTGKSQELWIVGH
jgi:hypothetical protein